MVTPQAKYSWWFTHPRNLKSSHKHLEFTFGVFWAVFGGFGGGPEAVESSESAGLSLYIRQAFWFLLFGCGNRRWKLCFVVPASCHPLTCQNFPMSLLPQWGLSIYDLSNFTWQMQETRSAGSRQDMESSQKLCNNPRVPAISSTRSSTFQGAVPLGSWDSTGMIPMKWSPYNCCFNIGVSQAETMVYGSSLYFQKPTDFLVIPGYMMRMVFEMWNNGVDGCVL